MYKIDASTQNLDALTSDGIYMIKAATQNTPEGLTTNGILFVFTSVGTPCQFFLPDNKPVIYKRWGAKSGTTTYGAWYKSSTFTAV